MESENPRTAYNLHLNGDCPFNCTYCDDEAAFLDDEDEDEDDDWDWSGDYDSELEDWDSIEASSPPILDDQDEEN